MAGYVAANELFGVAGEIGDPRRTARLIAAASAAFTAVIALVALLLALTT